MRLLVLGAGMMGRSAAFDMARTGDVEQVTLADVDVKRAKAVAENVSKLAKRKNVRAASIDVESNRKVQKLMAEHDGTLSCVPYFHNLDLAKSAVAAGCHFADLGGNNTVVRRELALDTAASKRGVRIAPDCGLSPGMASVLAGELMRRVGGRAEALKLYVGGLPQNPKPPFHYQLVFSVDGLINEYAEPARVLRGGKIVEVEPLTELESFALPGFPVLEAFHTSGGTSTLPETFKGKVGECFEKTLRYPGHVAKIRTLYEFGLFSKDTRKVNGVKLSPRAMMADLMCEKLAGNDADVTVMRIEAHQDGEVHSFTLVDKYDSRTKLTSMMRTTAWPASIVLQMLVRGEVEKTGAVLQERDVPSELFLAEMRGRGVEIAYSVRETTKVSRRAKRAAV